MLITFQARKDRVISCYARIHVRKYTHTQTHIHTQTHTYLHLDMRSQCIHYNILSYGRFVETQLSDRIQAVLPMNEILVMDSVEFMLAD